MMTEMSDPRWLDETEQTAWRGHLRVTWLLAAAVARDLARDSGLSAADYQVLVELSESENHEMRISELATSMMWSKSRLSHQLSRMKERRLVCRRECPSDARGSFAMLTPEGLEAITKAAPAHVDSVRRHFIDRLDRQQVEAMATISSTLVEHLNASVDVVACAEAAENTDCGG
jgi:DNA-binding MarR family transcriptional regulator